MQISHKKHGPGKKWQSGFSHHFVLPLLAILVVGGIGAYLTFASRAAEDTTPLRKTAGFIDSLGIAMHPGSSPYNKPDAKIVEKVEYLGLKHVRTNVDEGKAGVELINQLYEKGIRASFTVGRPKKPFIDNYKKPIDEEVAFLKKNFIGKADAIEGFNELNSKKNDPENFDAVLKAATPYIWDQTADLRKKGLKVYAPTIVGTTLPKSAPKLGAAISNTNFSYGNIHTYFSGRAPESTFPSSKTNEAKFNIDPEGKPANDRDIKLKYYAFYISKDKPMVITETGYQPDWGTESTDRMTSIYMPRAFMENFRIGVKRTYFYQLFDQGSGNGFGMFRNDTNDFEAKPVARAMHNLTSLLGGGTMDFTAQDLPGLDISGDTKNLRKVLMQKAPGEYWLALWRGESIYDTKKKKDITVEPKDLTVSMQEQHHLTFYSDLKSEEMSSENKGLNKEVTLPIGAEVCLLKISESSGDE